MKYNFPPFNRKDVVLRNGNKVVIKVDFGIPPAVLKELSFDMPTWHFCGYVALPKWKLPFFWWSSYKADGLQYLAIHGGITYSHTESSNRVLGKILDILQRFNRKVMNLSCKLCDRNIKYGENKMPLMPNYFKVRGFFDEVDNWLERILGNMVVYGFDCGHLGDWENPKLKDPKTIMFLTEQMERQILAYAKVYWKWFRADRGGRIDIIQGINSGEQFKVEPGFGAMIDMLCGGRAFGKKDFAKDREVNMLKRMFNKERKKK